MNILITGGASGIARSVLERFLNSEDTIYLTVHTVKQLQLAKKRYENYPNVKCYKLDITKREDFNVVKDFKIDVLINNAAIGVGGSIAEVPIHKVRENFEINVFSSFSFLQFIFAKMQQQGYGRIIVMGSLASKVPLPFLGVYSATKASIHMLVKSLQLELKEIASPIQIVLIEPGLYHTGFNQVMLDNKYEWMDYHSYFAHEITKIRAKEHMVTSFLEKRELSSITSKIEKAIRLKNPKVCYQAPFFQALGTRLYQFFQK